METQLIAVLSMTCLDICVLVLCYHRSNVYGSCVAVEWEWRCVFVVRMDINSDVLAVGIFLTEMEPSYSARWYSSRSC